MYKYLSIIFCLIALLIQSHVVIGSELLQDRITVEKGSVLEIIDERMELVSGTKVNRTVQLLRIKIIKGEEQGKILDISNDHNTFEVGDSVYVNRIIRAEDGVETHVISDADRLPTLLIFTLAFVLLTIIIGGIQGVRGLLSLVGSLVLIIFVLLPAVINGYSPIVVSIIVSSVIIVLGSYITHGFNKTTSSAVIGMIGTVLLTGLLAFVAVDFAKLTGFESEEAVFLNFNTNGSLDIVGILLGGIMIGLLGVLYDVAIGQAIAVEELHNIAPHISRYVIYKRAIRIGREHIGALVNTLAIAYVGASLPLLLLFFDSNGDFLQIMNREVFATEIIRTLVGSIGLVLAVPITTLISVFILFRKVEKTGKDVFHKEMEILEHHKHTH
jgi:uncharacterized membrane protein